MVTKKRVIWIVSVIVALAAGIVCGVLISRAVEDRERYKYCLDYDYSFIDLAEAVHVESDSDGAGTEYLLRDDLTVRLENSGDTVIVDSWSGQMRQYHNGVLFILSVAKYGDNGPSYRQYNIRSLEECEEIASALEKNDTQTLTKDGVRTWKMRSGEAFAD